MKTLIAEEVLSRVQSDGSTQAHVGRWRNTAIISFVSGAILGVLGLLLSFLSSLGLLSNGVTAARTESALILASFVLLITGAHCLDRLISIKMADK